VHLGVAGIGISGPLDVDVTGIEHIQVGGVDLMPVAAPHHTLAASRGNAPGAAPRSARRHDLIPTTPKSRPFGQFVLLASSKKRDVAVMARCSRLMAAPASVAHYFATGTTTGSARGRMPK
jgi:hypothetical protein